jgi:hypothetical protein
MKVAPLTLLVLALAAPASVLAAKPSAGTLSVEGAVGVVTVAGKGAVLGRVLQGSVRIVDNTPEDRWEPMINGIAGVPSYSLRGKNLTFRILGGDYRLVVRGEGISLAARGRGVATLDGDFALTGDAGIWTVGRDIDCRRTPEECEPLPDIARKVAFGPLAEKPE